MGFYYKRKLLENRLKKTRLKPDASVLEPKKPLCKSLFLFIIGMKRSGTSMMVGLLNMHSKICVTMESDIIWIAYQLKILKLDIKSLERYYLDGEGGMNKTIDICEKEILNHSDYSTSCFIKKCIEKISFNKYNNLIIGDKKPLQGSDLELFDFIESNLENIIYIHLWRDKQNVVRSWLDLTRQNPPFWLGHNHKIESLYDKTQRDCKYIKNNTKGKYIKVNYNYLLKNRKKELTRIFSLLDPSFKVTEEMINFIKH